MGKTALILGSGTDLIVTPGEWSTVGTAYGDAYLSSGDLGGTEIVLLRRHGPGRNVPPHLINYLANVHALAKVGVTRIISTVAVGSLREDIHPGDIGVVTDFIDFTKRRDFSIFDRVGDCVMHTDFSQPYCPEIITALESGASSVGVEIGKMTYLCVEGPRYETPAEVRMFAQWGGDVVGMTGVPEVVLSREMGLCYGSLAVVTNYATGISENPLSHDEVLQCMAERSVTVCEILERAVSAIQRAEHCCGRKV